MEKELIETLVDIRHELHSQPELSGKEYNTADIVCDYLADTNVTSLIEQVGGTGVLGVYDSKVAGPTIMIRAELDALPIQDINNHLYYASQKNNVSHKCGHDGHMTILLGLASLMKKQPLKKGKVVLLFQPAEETGEGAAAVLASTKFQSIKPDYVFALHNLPGYPQHQILVKSYAFTASVKSIIIKLHGRVSHAAEPEHGINPAAAIATIVQKTLALSNNDTARDDFAVVTPVHVNMGEKAYGVSAGYGEIHLTVRTWTEESMTQLNQAITQIVIEACKDYSIKSEINYTQVFTACENDEKSVEIIRQAAIENNLQLAECEFPFKWGEDFGLFTQAFKGAIFGLGAGEETPVLHDASYDFPDEIIPTGSRMFYSIISKILI